MLTPALEFSALIVRVCECLSLLKALYDKMTRGIAAQQTLLKCGNSMDVDEDICL